MFRLSLLLIAIAVAAIALFASCGGGGGTPQNNPFAGNYTGTYTGSENGTWTAVCRNDGTVTATITSPSVGTFAGNGTMTLGGQLTLICTGSGVGGPFTITWQGTFQMQNSTITGSGTWVSTSGFNGPWTGQYT